MREIKFRGLRKDGKGWVYGYYYATRRGTDDPLDIHLIVFEEEGNSLMAKVIPETVGQYTGLKDKSGKDIYEGDKVMYSDKSTPLVVGFENGSFVLKKDRKTYVYNINPKELEVIGNIHEN